MRYILIIPLLWPSVCVADISKALCQGEAMQRAADQYVFESEHPLKPYEGKQKADAQWNSIKNEYLKDCEGL